MAYYNHTAHYRRSKKTTVYGTAQKGKHGGFRKTLSASSLCCGAQIHLFRTWYKRKLKTVSICPQCHNFTSKII